MPVEESYPNTGQQVFSDINTRLRDIEEKQRLLKDRLLIVGNSLVEEKEESLIQIREMKKIILQLKGENVRMKELIQNIIEKLEKTARKEDFAILQRQLDILRKY